MRMSSVGIGVESSPGAGTVRRPLSVVPRILFFQKQSTIRRFPLVYLPPMLAVVIVLLLLTALVATEPSSPGGGD